MDLGEKRESETDKEVGADSKSSAGSDRSSASPLPIRLLSFTTGFVVGTPIAIGRCAYKQTRAGTKDLVGDSTNPLLVVPATIISIPFGIMGGPFEGVGSAAVNSWKGSGQDPFGPESFSLGSRADWDRPKYIAACRGSALVFSGGESITEARACFMPDSSFLALP